MKAIIAVGSSLQPERHIPRGLERLDRVAPVLAASPWYRSAAFGRPGDPDFVNGAVAVITGDTADKLRSRLRLIERAEGRRRWGDKSAPRCLDLDLIVHDGKVIDAEALRRRFVALPVLALEPSLRLPDGSQLSDPGDWAMDEVPVPMPWPLTTN